MFMNIPIGTGKFGKDSCCWLILQSRRESKKK